MPTTSVTCRDRRQGRRVAGRSGAPRPDQTKLRAAAADPRVARPRPAPPLLVRGADHRAEPHAQAAGERQHQVGQRRQPGVRRVRPGDAEGADREHRHAPGDGGLGEAEVAPQAGALALDGRLSEHHRYLLAFHLRRVEAIEADLRALDERIEEKAQPYAAQRRLLRQIPGVDDRIAVAIIAEIGIDMTVFGNARRLAAWACPGNHESAGKKKSTAARKDNIHLKTTLVQACAARTKGSYDKDKYHRLKARRGSQRAAMAIAHKILVAV